MRTIVELNLLLRERVELPEGFKLGTEEFREGWKFSRSLNVLGLGKQILNRGWNLIKIGDGPHGSGVGDRPQNAIAGALKLALRRIDEYCNAAEVSRIQLTQYPWFFLARVGIRLYRIQQSAVVSAPENAGWLPIARHKMRLPRQPYAIYSGSSCTMPLLREMPILLRNTLERTQ
jgi:hypothetical protein